MENSVGSQELGPQDFKGTPFKLLELIGRGSFGKTYKCEEKVNGRLVAIKVPKHYTPVDKNERRILMRICRREDPDNINIIKFFGVVKVKGVPSLVMEYLPINLSVFLCEKGPMRISQVRCLGIQLLTAINFLKDLRIVHGDIKPQNIMVANPDEEGQAVRVKLIDLGGFEVSKDKPPQVRRVLTFVYYRSPEVVMGLPASFPIDVWAVSVVCLEAFMGRTVFPAEGNQELVTYFLEMFGDMPKDLLEGKYVSMFFKVDSHGVFSRKVSEPYYPCPLGYEFDGLLDFADTECERYQYDTEYFLEFLKAGLCLTPINRITAEKALEEYFFTTDHFIGDGSDHEKEARQLLESLH